MKKLLFVLTLTASLAPMHAMHIFQRFGFNVGKFVPKPLHLVQKPQPSRFKKALKYTAYWYLGLGAAIQTRTTYVQEQYMFDAQLNLTNDPAKQAKRASVPVRIAYFLTGIPMAPLTMFVPEFRDTVFHGKPFEIGKYVEKKMLELQERRNQASERQQEDEEQYQKIQELQQRMQTLKPKIIDLIAREQEAKQNNDLQALQAIIQEKNDLLNEVETVQQAAQKLNSEMESQKD